MKSHQKYYIPYINNVRYNKNFIKNIISMKDSKEKLALLVHMPNKIVKLKQILNGLYSMDPNDEKSFVLNKKEYQFMNML